MPTIEGLIKVLHEVFKILAYYSEEFLTYKVFKAFVIGAATFLGWLIGWYDAPIQGLLIVYCLDWAFALAYAKQTKSFNSKKAWRGIGKFVCYSGALIMGYQLDRMAFGDNIPFFSAHFVLIFWLWVNECLSISKHLASLGFPLPAKFLEAIINYRDTLGITNEKETCVPIPEAVK